MAKILTYNSPAEVEKSASRTNPIRSVWPWIQSRDKFVKASIVTMFLVIVATPFIASQYIDIRQHADIQGLVASINSYRKSENSSLPPLFEDQALITAACFKAKDMADNNYFSHQDLQENFIWPMLNSLGVQNEYMGEIIGKNIPDSVTIIQYWKNSPPHKNLLLESKYTRVGVGRAVSADGTTYWTSVFASGVPQPVNDWKCNDTPLPQPNPSLTPVFSSPESGGGGAQATTPTPTIPPSPNEDTDGDGFTDMTEVYLGTNFNEKCLSAPTSGSPNINWPADLNGDNKVDKSDAEAFGPYFGKRAADSGFSARFDMNKNGLINGQDVLTLNKFMNKVCQ